MQTYVGWDAHKHCSVFAAVDERGKAAWVWAHEAAQVRVVVSGEEEDRPDSMSREFAPLAKI